MRHIKIFLLLAGLFLVLKCLTRHRAHDFTSGWTKTVRCHITTDLRQTMPITMSRKKISSPMVARIPLPKPEKSPPSIPLFCIQYPDARLVILHGLTLRDARFPLPRRMLMVIVNYLPSLRRLVVLSVCRPSPWVRK